MGNVYESDSSGCSSSSEDLIVLASAVSTAFAFMSTMHICANTSTDSNRMRSGTRGGSTPGKDGNRERSRVEGDVRIDADYSRGGHTAKRAPLSTSENSNDSGLYRVLCMKSESKVIFAYASIRVKCSSIVQFFARLRRLLRAASVCDGSLAAPCAVVACYAC
jgi:hypothetical protein